MPLVRGSRFSVLGSRFSVLGSRFSVLGSRFSVLGGGGAGWSGFGSGFQSGRRSANCDLLTPILFKNGLLQVRKLASLAPPPWYGSPFASFAQKGHHPVATFRARSEIGGEGIFSV